MTGLRQQQRTQRLNRQLCRGEGANPLFPRMDELNRDEQRVLYRLAAPMEPSPGLVAQYTTDDFAHWGLDLNRLICLGLVVITPMKTAGLLVMDCAPIKHKEIADFVQLTRSGQSVIDNEARRKLAHGQMFIEYHRAE